MVVLLLSVLCDGVKFGVAEYEGFILDVDVVGVVPFIAVGRQRARLER